MGGKQEEKEREPKSEGVLSDQEFSSNLNGHRFRPDLDIDKQFLYIEAKSGKIFQIPVRV